jgi:hypothetical protein
VAGTVPVKSFALPYNSPYSWVFEIDGPTFEVGCYAAVSSTPSTYTAITYEAGVTYCDFQGEYVLLGVQLPTGLTLVGDSTTSRDGLQLWSTPLATLYTLNYTNLTSGTRYLMMFPSLLEDVANADTPQLIWAVAANATLNLVFADMFLFATNKGTAPSRSVYVSTTAATLTKNTSLEGRIWAYIKV